MRVFYSSVYLMSCRFVPGAIFLFAASLFGQGNLTPPGGPAPTMKTLDQVEPRTPISAATTPGDSNDAFIITNSGSYYLTTNFVSASAKNGIRIAADGVTIDLNGFELNGGGVGLNGIRIITSVHRQNITIRNGGVRNWTFNGIEISFSLNALVEKILAAGNGANGISAGENAVVRDCLAYTNAASGSFLSGIVASQGSVVERCVADLNGGTNTFTCFGISVSSGSTVSHCSASQNNSPGGSEISAGAFCTVSECTASFGSGTNGAGISVGTGGAVLRCTSSGNSGSGKVGILASQRSVVEGCTVVGNGGDGIQAPDNCSVQSNMAGNNSGAGIHTTGQRNRIDGNNVTANTGGGIKVDSNLNLVIRNSVSGNSSNNYIIAAGNQDAERLGGGTGFTSTDPWANFSF